MKWIKVGDSLVNTEKLLAIKFVNQSETGTEGMFVTEVMFVTETNQINLTVKANMPPSLVMEDIIQQIEGLYDRTRQRKSRHS